MNFTSQTSTENGGWRLILGTFFFFWLGEFLVVLSIQALVVDFRFLFSSFPSSFRCLFFGASFSPAKR